MPKSRKKYPLAQPMRIQALQGSLAEKRLSLPLIPSGLEIEGSCRSWVYAYV